MKFTGSLTLQGRALLAKSMGLGVPLEVTRVVAGSAFTPDEAQTLADPRQSVTISDRTTDGSLATIMATLSAAEAPEVYTLTELGVYARDPEAGEILYQVFRLDQSVEISPASRLVIRTYLRLAVSDDLALSLSLPPSGLLVEADVRNKADLVNGVVPFEQLPHTRSAVNLYVDTAAGSDENPGTKALPFQTIQAALNSLPVLLTGIGGVTVHIGPGVYEEGVSVGGFAAGHHWNTPLTLSGAGEDQTFIKGPVTLCANIPVRVEQLHISKGGSTEMVGAYFNTVVFDHVTFDGAGAVLGSDLAAPLRLLGANAFVSNCTFKNAPQYAILCTGFLSCWNLKGEHNTVGIRAGMEPGHLAVVVTGTLPEGFAQTKFLKAYGVSMIFEGGVAV